MAKKVMVRVSPNTGDPTKGNPDSEVLYTTRSPMARKLDVRDHLAELIGRGNSLSPKDRGAIYNSLSQAVGPEKAGKIMTHTYIFNQRPDLAKLPIEDRLRSFYTIGSNDADVNDIITKSKAIGYGVLPGFRESSSGINQLLAGRISSL